MGKSLNDGFLLNGGFLMLVVLVVLGWENGGDRERLNRGWGRRV